MSLFHKLISLSKAKWDSQVLGRGPFNPNNNTVKNIREPITYYGLHDKVLKKMFYRRSHVSSSSVVNADSKEGFLHGQKPH